MKKSFNPATGIATFTFEDGVAPLTVTVSKASETMQRNLLGHGILARVGDKGAIAKSADNGFRVTEAMRRAAMVPLAEHIESGADEWDLRGGARLPVQNPTWAALAAARGVAYDVIAAEKAAADIAELMAMTSMKDVRHGE